MCSVVRPAAGPVRLRTECAFGAPNIEIFQRSSEAFRRCRLTILKTLPNPLFAGLGRHRPILVDGLRRVVGAVRIIYP